MTGKTDKRPAAGSVVLKYVVPLVISTGLCWLLFRSFDFRTMWHVIRTECDPRWIVPAVLLGTAAMFFRALRWRIQLDALGVRASFYTLLLSMFGTYAVNLVFPRLGEVWRTGYVSQRQDAPFSTVFGSMVSDRLADTITVALLALVAFALSSGTILDYLNQGGDLAAKVRAAVLSPWLWVTLAAVGAALWWLMSRKSTGLAGRLQAFVRGLWQGFAVIVTMPGKGRWLLYTAGVWGCYFLQLLCSFESFGFTRAIVHEYGLTAVLVSFVLSSISMGVPSNGGIGPWQWAMMFALGIYGLDSTDAAAFANFTLGVTTLLVIVLGLYAFIAIPLERRRHR